MLRKAPTAERQSRLSLIPPKALHSSPLGMPINTGDSERKVKSEEYFDISLALKQNKAIWDAVLGKQPTSS